MVRKQKAYSLPLPVSERISKLFEDNKEDFAFMGVTSETRLLEVLARNGEPAVHELLDDLKMRRKARQAPQK